MLLPTEIVQIPKQHKGEKPQEVLKAAVCLTNQLVNFQTYDQYTIDALAELSAEHPYVVEAIIDRLVDHVLQGVNPDANDRVYRQNVAHLALDLATSVPDTADRTIELIRAIDELEIDEDVLDEFFIQISERNTTVLIETLDVVLKADDLRSHVRPERGRALVHGFQTDPELFKHPIRELRCDLPSRRSLEQLGNIGLVLPDAVESAIPEIIGAATADDVVIRAAAIEALGLIAGTTPRTEDSYGQPLETSSTDILDTLESGLDDSSQEVSETAAKALVRATNEDDTLRERGVDALLLELGTPDSSVRRYEAFLHALDNLADDSRLPERAADPLIDRLASADNPKITGDLLKVLGQVNATAVDQERIEQALIDGLKADDRQIQRGAAMGVTAWAAHQPSVSNGLIKVLVETTTNDSWSVRDNVFEALAEVDRRDCILDAIEEGIGRHRNGQAVGEAIVALEADSAVKSVVDRLNAVFLMCSTENGLEADETEVKASSTGFSKEQNALIDTLDTISSTAPEMLIPHTGRLVDIVTEDPAGREIDTLLLSVAKALEALVEASPASVQPHSTQLLECLFSNPDRQGAGRILNTLLIVNAAESETIDSIAETISGPALSPALCRLAHEDPLTVLRAVSELEIEFWVSDDHMHVGGWLHAIDELGMVDVRVHGPTLDLYGQAITADDHWVQLDGAAYLANTAASHSQRVERFSPFLATALADNSDYVTTWLLRSLGWTGAEATSVTVDAFRSHPGSATREAAEDAYARLTDDLSNSTDTNSSMDWAETAMWEVTLSDGPIPAAISSDDDKCTKFLAVLFVSLQHPNEQVRTRARATLDKITKIESDSPDNPASNSGETSDLRVLVPFFTDDEPVVRALATYTAGAAAGAHDGHVIAAVVNRLRPVLEDEEVLVQRWAARTLSMHVQQCSGAVGEFVPTLTKLLDRDDSTTRTHIVRTLAALANEDPDLVEPAVDAIVQTLDNSNEAIQLDALKATLRLSPSTLVSSPGVTANALSALDHGTPEINQRGADLIAVLSEADPSTLRDSVGELVDSSGGNSIRRAISNVASEFPELVAPYADSLADGTNDIHTRRTLVSLRSSRYPDLLERFLQDHPTGLQNELDSFVEFTVSVPDSKPRQRAVRTMARETTSVPGLLDQVLKALAVELTTDDPTARQHAAEAVSLIVRERDIADLGSVLRDAVLPTLVTWAGEGQWPVRSQAVQTLRTIVDVGPESISDESYHEIVNLALGRLGDEHGWTRRHAAKLLGKIPTEVREEYHVFEDVINRSLSENDDGLLIRGETLAIGTIAVANQQYERALEVLLERTTHADQWVRRNAIEGFTMIVSTEEFDPNRDLSTETDVDADQVRTAIKGALADSDPTTRAEACRCLGFWGTIDNLGALEALTTDPQSRVQTEANRARARLENNEELE